MFRFNGSDVARAYAVATPAGLQWYWSIFGINLCGPLPVNVEVQGLADDLEAAKMCWLSIEDNPPPKIGWYAVIRRFRDRPDRFSPGSGYWDGTSWHHGHIFARSPQVFGNQNSAESWAYVHQWLGSPPFATTPAKAHLHSKEDKNVADLDGEVRYFSNSGRKADINLVRLGPLADTIPTFSDSYSPIATKLTISRAVDSWAGLLA